jgi:transcriptional regulator with XRE-family HTH domain
MREALTVRNISRVYRLLQRYGVSQRRIAERVGMNQSEVSEILGGRRVVSYDVLARIADGLGVPRGWMGLALVFEVSDVQATGQALSSPPDLRAESQ